MDYLEKRLYDLEMIRDKLENKIREIYHSIVNKIKIKYFKKTNLDSDKLILYPENKNQAIYFDLETSIAYEKLGEESYMKVGLVINNELVIDDKVKEMEIELRKMTVKLSGNINIDNEIQFQLKIYNNLKQILENVVSDPKKKLMKLLKGDIIKFYQKI